MSGKSYSDFQWTDGDIQLLLEAPKNLKVEKDYKRLNWELNPGLTLTIYFVTLHTKSKMNAETL